MRGSYNYYRKGVQASLDRDRQHVFFVVRRHWPLSTHCFGENKDDAPFYYTFSRDWTHKSPQSLSFIAKLFRGTNWADPRTGILKL